MKNREKRVGTYRSKGKPNEGGNAFVATDGSSDGNEVLVAFAGCTNSGDEWILDSTASFHVCINRDWFIRYDSVNGGYVKMVMTVRVRLLVLVLFRSRCLMVLSEL